MSDTDNSSSSPLSSSLSSSLAGFGKFVPGFDFLQNLATQASQAAGSAAQKIPQLPNLGNWVAPTLNVEELDRRIDELKAVQFWLDQNATALKATIQALEVQKMTLATLKGMNFNMGDVANAFKLKVADSMAGGVQRVADKAKTFSGLEIPPSSFQASQAAAHDEQAAEGQQEAKASKSSRARPAKAPAAGGVVDPMQWWGALTQQFQAIATDAMKEAAKKTAMDTTRNMAKGLAKDTMKSATSLAKNVAKGVASSASKTVAGGARAAMNTALRSSQGWPTPAPVKKPAKQPAVAKTPAAKKTASRTRPARKSAR